MKVVKRNGEAADFDISKIRFQIEKATEGIPVNSIELESKISDVIKNNISTSDIQEIIVHSAVQLANTENTSWLLVAGRLMTHQIHREAYKNTKIDQKEFVKYIKYAKKNGYYRSDVTEAFSDEHIMELQNNINKAIENRSDFNRTIAQVLSLKSKYLAKNKRGVIEYSLFSDMSTSMILAKIETPEDRIKITLEYFKMLKDEYLSLGTPFKANLRRKNGNTGSCFIMPVGDSLEQISKSWRDAGKVSKEGGGLGMYLGHLRPGGTYTKNIPKSNNITKWVKIINDIAVAVNQRGIRPGAITPAIDWFHTDIHSFIEMKSETGGELREKAFDIYPQVIVDSYFIDAVLEDREVYLFNHYQYNILAKKNIQNLINEELYEAHIEAARLIESGKLKHYKKIKAKELWKEFLRIWVETGDFYIAHRDNLNLSNYLAPELIANAGNLCQESWSVTKIPTEWNVEYTNKNANTIFTDGMYHSCSLLSIAVGNIKNDDTLERVSRNAVRMLDASLDVSTMPVAEAAESAQNLRNIGIGMIGLADWLAYNKFTYADLDEIEKLQEKIAYWCYDESIKMAEEKGSYVYYDRADYSQMFGKTPEELNRMSLNNFDWVELNQRIRTKGIRNFLLLAIAPNTSTGILMNQTASWLPPQSKFFYQTLADMNAPIAPKYLNNRFWFYKGKFDYKVTDLIKVVRRLQKWVDTGISMEVPINPQLVKVNEISDEILDGFKTKELKTVYYSLTVDGNHEQCVSCEN